MVSCRQRGMLVGCIGVVLSLVTACGAGNAAPSVVMGTGDNVAAKVDEYRSYFGGQNNGGDPGTKGTTGYREINWDGLTDEQSAPAVLAPDVFNQAVAPFARGARLETPGQGVMASADSDNPTGTLPRFGNFNPTYADIFKTFSAERLFSPVGNNTVDLTFFVPGTSTPAGVRGFGAIYTDVDTDHTAFEYFDINNVSLGKFQTPTADNGLSFLGVIYLSPIVHRVRIAYGTDALGPSDGAGVDVAVMDNFIYGEPQALP